MSLRDPARAAGLRRTAGRAVHSPAT